MHSRKYIINLQNKFKYNSYQKIFAYVLLLIIAIAIQFLLWPLLITNDGTTYISSAYNLFSANELTYYYWIREPGYPLLLKIHFLNTTFGVFLLKATQTIFIYTSVFLVFEICMRIAGLKTKISYLISLFFIITFLIDYSIYSTIVLQQSLFAFIGSLFTLILYKSIKVNSIKNFKHLVLLFLILVFISVNLIVFYKYISLILVPIVTLSYLKIANTSKPIKKLINYFFITLFLMATPFIFALPWDAYKSSRLDSSQSALVAMTGQGELYLSTEPSPTQPVPSNPTSDQNVVPENFRTTELPDAITVFNNYRKEIRWNTLEFFQYQEDPLIRNENNFFKHTLIQNRKSCIHTVSSQWFPFFDFTDSFVSKDCKFLPIKSNFLIVLLELLSIYSLYMFRILANIYIFVFIILSVIFGSRFILISIFSLVFATAYILSANTLDRYTIPQYPYYIAFTFFLILILKIRFFTKISSFNNFK